MKADFESERAELAKRGARFCHNPREAVMEWNAIKSGFADAIECLRAGSFSIIEMSISRVRLQRFIESFGHSLKKRPEIFDAESLKVLSQLEGWTLEWVRQEAKTKGTRFVDTPGKSWMEAWQGFCTAYESFLSKVEFELAHEELAFAGDGKRKPASKVNAKGDQAAKVVGYLGKHHEYDAGHVVNYHPAESADIAKESKVSASTVSDFLKREFPSSGSPRTGYIHACKSKAPLLRWFMVKHGDQLPTRNADISDYDEKTIRQKW